MAEIVHEDEQIRVMWKPGTGDTLLISFGDLQNLASNDRFFADGPATKADLPSIGIMAKSGNWYPTKNIKAARRSLTPFLDKYSTRFLYGGSMGGYAAVKYSSLFGATFTLSLCPQWSLDPGECEIKPGWSEYFTPGMSGMGIRSRDVSGRVYVFSDLGNRRDRFHATAIRANAKDVSVFNVPTVGHHVTRALAGTENLKALMKHCADNDTQALRRITSSSRRKSWHRIRNLLAAAMARRPASAAAIMENYQRIHPGQPFSLPSSFAFTEWLFKYKGANASKAFVSNQLHFCRSFTNYSLLSLHMCELSGRSPSIRTFTDSPVYYNMDRSYCFFGNDKIEGPQNRPVFMEIDGSQTRLYFQVGGVNFYLANRTDGLISISSSRATAEIYTADTNGKGGISIRGASGFLSAQPDGRVRNDRPRAKEWESFSLG